MSTMKANTLKNLAGTATVSVDKVLHSDMDTGWITPTLLNGWVNYDVSAHPPAGFRKLPDGTVMIKGLIKNGTVLNAAFVLPPGFRPLSGHLFSCFGGNFSARIDVYPSGVVYMRSGVSTDYQSIEISFYAEQ